MDTLIRFSALKHCISAQFYSRFKISSVQFALIDKLKVLHSYLPPFLLVFKYFSHYEFFWNFFGSFSSFHCSLTSSFNDHCFQSKIMKNMFGHKSRSLFFLKILLFLLKLRTFYMVLAPLWLMKWKFKQPLVLLLYLLYMIEKLRKKWKFCNLIPQRPRTGKTIYQLILHFQRQI